MIYSLGLLEPRPEFAIPFGLGSSVWTSDPAEEARFVRDVQAGMTAVNQMLSSTPEAPFGGVKASGLGREGGSASTQFVDGNGVIGDGVVNVGTEENPQYVPNTTAVAASTFNNAYYDRGNEASALYDASYLKLRQLSIYYTFSDNTARSIGVDNLKIGLVGSNLLLFTENPHFDNTLDNTWRFPLDGF